MNRKRTLIYNYLRLPYYKQMRIAQGLGLLENDDVNLDEMEQRRAIIRRAVKMKKIKQLEEAVNQA